MVLCGSSIPYKLVSDNCPIPERFIARWYKELLIMKSSQHVVFCVEFVWNLMAYGEAREGKWRGNWRMEWVASTLTLPQNVVYPVLLTLMRTPRLLAFDWTDAPADFKFSAKHEIWFLRVCHQVSNALYQQPSYL